MGASTTDSMVAGNVEIGQRVDFFATIESVVLAPIESSPPGLHGVDGAETPVEAQDPAGFLPGKITKVTWSDIEILAKDEDADLYTLKVDLHQAEEISHLMASKDLGDVIDFSFALRPDGDNRVIDRSSYGETNNRIIEQYNLPIPMIIDLDTYVQPSSAPAPFVPGQALPSPEVTPDPESAPDVSPAPEASPEAAP